MPLSYVELKGKGNVHIYIYTHICVYVHMRIQMYTYIHTDMCIYIYVCIHVYMYTCIHTYIRTYVRTYTYIHIYTYIRVCVCCVCLDTGSVRLGRGFLRFLTGPCSQWLETKFIALLYETLGVEPASALQPRRNNAPDEPRAPRVETGSVKGSSMLVWGSVLRGSGRTRTRTSPNKL